MAIRTVNTSGGGDFASLAAAVADLPEVFTEDEIIEVAGSVVDTAQVHLIGFDTTQDYRLIIRPAAGQHHGGRWNDEVYRLVVANTPIDNQARRTYIGPIQIAVNTDTSSVRYGIRDRDMPGASAVERIVDGAIIVHAPVGGTPGQRVGLAADHHTVTAAYRNCLVSGFSTPGGTGIASIQSTNAYFYNNTVLDSEIGIARADGTATAINNIVQGATTAYSGTFTPQSSHNISNDSTAPGTSAVTNHAVSFADPAEVDAHLAESIPGANLSSVVNYPFTTDIDGDTRSTWDIGADEFDGGGDPPDPNERPATPSITASATGETTASLSSSAFSDPDAGDTHTASQWQVTLSGDTGFNSPVFDSGTDTSNLLSRSVTGLVAGTQYRARVRHRDSSGDSVTEWSQWSAAATFTTDEVPATHGAISDTVTLGGNPVQGARVWLIDTTSSTLDSTVTDASGQFTFSDLPLDRTYTVAVQHESGGAQYSAVAKPFLSPEA